MLKPQPQKVLSLFMIIAFDSMIQTLQWRTDSLEVDTDLFSSIVSATFDYQDLQ